MKKILLNILIFVLVFTLSACGVYHGVESTDRNSVSESTSIGNEGEDSGDEEEMIPFTVQLTLVSFDADDNEIRKPFTRTGNMQVQWRNTFGVHRAEIDGEGKASITGLDGEYHVSLLGLSDKYVYDPNKYEASNVNRDIEIDIYEVERTRGKGTGEYNTIKLTKLGVYAVTISKPTEKVYFEYKPSKSGQFFVESWADIEENKVNPYVDVYFASAQYRNFAYTLDDGGSESTYTKNFRYDEMKLDSSSLGGGVFVFAIGAHVKNNEYPVTINFQVDYWKPYQMNLPISDIMLPNGLYGLMLNQVKPYLEMAKTDFEQASVDFSMATVGWQSPTMTEELQVLYDHYEELVQMPVLLENLGGIGNTLLWMRGKIQATRPSGTWTYPEVEYNGVNQFDGSLFEYNEEDGVYHVYDEVKYADNDGWGPVLYAQITQPTRFFAPYNGMPISLVNIEDPGNKCLTVSQGTENYKLFIQGYSSLATSKYFCGTDCKGCHKDPITQEDLVCNDVGLTCLPGCLTCTKSCRGCPAEAKNVWGYAQFVNTDGAYPVTKEMQEFLQKFAVAQRYFMDGNGWAETYLQPTIDCKEEDQWLFACGYYR